MFHPLLSTDLPTLNKQVPKVYTSLAVSSYKAESKTLRHVAIARFLLSVFSLLRAALMGGPGVSFHAYIAFRAATLFGTGFTIGKIYSLITAPMDSVRYFEFHFFWNALKRRHTLGNYLDVSSPRLFSWRVICSKRIKRATIINPDLSDLRETKNLYKASGMDRYCDFRNIPVSAVEEPAEYFDTIACISVLEHIQPREARVALRKMWESLKSGGSLFLSVPCAEFSFDEYMNFNEYGLLEPEENGFVFSQRFYDEELIESEIYSIVGLPEQASIFGEKIAGTFFRDREIKISDYSYPFWEESFIAASRYKHFDRISELPGVGVIALEFVKL